MRTLVALAVIAVAAQAHAAPTKKAKLKLGASTVTSTYDQKQLTAVFKRAEAKLLACYKTTLAKRDAFDGDSVATFTIGLNGKVTGPTVAGLDETVDKCLADVVGKLVFAKPKEGSPIGVTFTLHFESGALELELQGGFGYGAGGLGVGGGGTGIGTIGTGRYGTIGTGTGTGTGYGVGSGRGGMKGRSSAVPTVSLGQMTSAGDLDKAIVRRYIKRNIQRIQYCYEKQLLATPTLAGTVKSEFKIGTDGRVSSSTATGLQTDVDACIAGVIKAIEFPKPKTGEVDVTQPFTFRPSSP